MKLKKVDFINLENKIKYQLELHEKSQTIENSLAFIYNILKWEIFTFYNPKSNIGLDYWCVLLLKKYLTKQIQSIDNLLNLNNKYKS